MELSFLLARLGPNGPKLRIKAYEAGLYWSADIPGKEPIGYGSQGRHCNHNHDAITYSAFSPPDIGALRLIV